MLDLRFIFFVLGIPFLQFRSIQSCVAVIGHIGSIYHYPEDDYSYDAGYELCWDIGVPDNKFIQLKITDLRLYKGCNNYQTLQIHVKFSNESYTFCKIDTTTYPITALTDVQIKLVSEQLSYGEITNDVPTFTVDFEIRDIECARKDTFHCSNDICIPKNKICDGVKDCGNGIDEVGCVTGISSIKGVADALSKEVKYVKTKRTSTWGWHEYTPRAVLALFLAGETKLDGTKLEEELMAKQIELKTSIALLKNSLAIEQLSTYINGLLVTCHNPRRFYGQNLIKRLKEQMEFSGNVTHPIAYLTLCNANETWSQEVSNDLLRILNAESDHPFLKDYQAFAVMAISCYENQTKSLRISENGALKTKYTNVIQHFKQLQMSDGSFGNLHSTSLISQALISSSQVYSKDWNLNAAIRYLIQNLETPHDLLASFMILPVLNAKTLSDVSRVNCSSNPRKIGYENFVSEIKDYAGPKIRVQYSLFVGDQKDVIHTIYLRVPENCTAFEVMKFAEAEDSKFIFKHKKISGMMYVHQIGAVTNDPEAGLFWLLYKGLDNQTNILNNYILSPDQLVMQNKEHLVMWYKKAHI